MYHICYICLILFLVILAFHNKSEIKMFKEYRTKYFNEQLKSELYRSCLYIAITDMIKNKWYDGYYHAFSMLRCRLKPYKYDEEFNKINPVTSMLFWGDQVKFSYDYEYELQKKGVDKDAY